ncbi:MAG: hypothetical protein Q9228_007242 [Teloschistes exilis]
MAPMSVDKVDDQIKDVIHDLYSIQAATHGYVGPQTQQELVRLVYAFPGFISGAMLSTLDFIVLTNRRTQLTGSLATLSNDASALPTQITPEIIEYVDEGRNPDIYTREFVELVQKSNQYMKGKSEAFAGFRDAMAQEIVKAWPEMKADVDQVLREGEPDTASRMNGTTRP